MSEQLLKILRKADGTTIVESFKDDENEYRDFAAGDRDELEKHVSGKLNEMFPHEASTVNVVAQTPATDTVVETATAGSTDPAPAAA